MTWKEVKETIEAGGVTDSMEMWFIDISFDWDFTIVIEKTEDKTYEFYVNN